MLNLKRLLTKLLVPKKTTFTPQSGNAYSAYGGCFYEQLGALMHVHLGLENLTVNTRLTVFTMPTNLRPKYVAAGRGMGNGLSTACAVQVTTSGNIYIFSEAVNCCVDIFYLI